MNPHIKSYVTSFLELIYPEKNTCFICETCNEKIADVYICPDCEKKLKKIQPPVCSKCSKPINYRSSIDLCSECCDTKRYFTMSKSPYAYEGIIQKAIHRYKYHNKPYFYKFFGSLIINFMEEINYTNFDLIVSVPLHPSKMRKRGYNQSELIAKYLASKLSIPYADVLKRTKKTSPQSGQSKSQRRRNIKDAFEIKSPAEKVINSSILLVDDIYTTGSTVDECSKVLVNYGAANVYVITIAR